LAPLRTDNVLAHNLILGGGTIAAGVLGVAFQSLVSHQLRPADYGAVFAVVTLLTFISLPASAFMLLMARETSRDEAYGASAPSTALLRGANRALLFAGFGCAVLLALAAQLIARFFNVPAPLLWAAAAGLPFALASPLLMGEFQGQQRFVEMATLSTGQAGLKLIGAIGLGLLWGPVGVVGGISLGGAVVYAVAYWMLRRKLAVNSGSPWLRPAVGYLALILPSTLAVAVLLSTDVLIVKHLFPSRQAGEYSAVAAIGRAIFWGATGVAGVLFPKMVFRESQGGSGNHLIGASLTLVALGGIGGLALFTFGSRWLLTAFAGGAYADAAGYVAMYALAMTLFGAATVFIATQQSRGKRAFLAVLLPFTLLEPALLVAFHRDLTQLVQVLDIAMALLFVGLGAQFILQERVEHAARIAEKRSQEATASALMQVQVPR